MNFEFERVFFEAKYSHRIFLNKFTKNFHNFFWIYGVFIYFCFEMKMFFISFQNNVRRKRCNNESDRFFLETI